MALAVLAWVLVAAGRPACTYTARPGMPLQARLDALRPGDVLCLRAGTYSEGLSLGQSGAPGRPITLRSFPGEEAVLEGTGREWKYPIDLGGDPTARRPGAGHWVIEGLTVTNWRREGAAGYGVVCWYGCEDLTLRNLRISGVETAVKLLGGVRGVLVEGITATGLTGGGFDCGARLDSGELLGCEDVVVRNFKALHARGGDDTAIDGFAVEHGRRITIEDSVAKGFPGDGFDLKSDDTRLRRVTSIAPSRNGIKLWGRRAEVEDSVSIDSGREALVLAPGGVYRIANSTFGGVRARSYTVIVGYKAKVYSELVFIGNEVFNNNPANTGQLVYIEATVTAMIGGNTFFNPYRLDCVVNYRRCFAAHQIPGPWSSGGDRYGEPSVLKEGRLERLRTRL